MIYKEKVTKEKLLKYLNLFDIIEIMPLKDDNPIFILKSSKVVELLVPRNDKVIIHRGRFIWANKERLKQRVLGDIDTLKYYPTGALSEDGFIEIPTDEHPTYYAYPSKFAKKAYASKEFSIKSIKDKKISLYDPRYIKPIKDLFRKHGILKEKRGKKKKPSAALEKRRQFVRDELKAITVGKIIKHKGIQGIYDRWVKYVNEKYKDTKEADKHIGSYINIWRDCQKLKNFS